MAVKHDEWTTLQAALAFGGFMDAAETERVTVWASEEIERLRKQREGAVSALEKMVAVADLEATGDDTLSATWVAAEARKALARLGGQ